MKLPKAEQILAFVLPAAVVLMALMFSKCFEHCDTNSMEKSRIKLEQETELLERGYRKVSVPGCGSTEWRFEGKTKEDE